MSYLLNGDSVHDDTDVCDECNCLKVLCSISVLIDYTTFMLDSVFSLRNM